MTTQRNTNKKPPREATWNDQHTCSLAAKTLHLRPVYFQIFKNCFTKIGQVHFLCYVWRPRGVGYKPPQSCAAFISQALFLSTKFTYLLTSSCPPQIRRSLSPSRGLEHKSCHLNSQQLMPGFSVPLLTQPGGRDGQIVMIIPKILIWKSPSVQPRRSPRHFPLILVIYHPASRGIEQPVDIYQLVDMSDGIL